MKHGVCGRIPVGGTHVVGRRTHVSAAHELLQVGRGLQRLGVASVVIEFLVWLAVRVDGLQLLVENMMVLQNVPGLLVVCHGLGHVVGWLFGLVISEAGLFEVLDIVFVSCSRRLLVEWIFVRIHKEIKLVIQREMLVHYYLG